MNRERLIIQRANDLANRKRLERFAAGIIIAFSLLVLVLKNLV